MTGTDQHVSVLIYALLIILPVSALIARRVPLLRVVTMLAVWGGLFALLLFVVAQRQRFDPMLARITAMLGLDTQRVEGREVRIRMASDGHFWATATIDGVRRRLLIDSGATVTALSVGTAAGAGLDVAKPTFPMMLQTANGTVSADTATVASLKLGDIEARDLGVVVSPAFGDGDVLGMNFLSRLKSWRVEGDTLILVPHHPTRDFT